ncbi:SPOR domain-containing protein [Thermosulfurimonas sp. F29]|uniref:SPOR domain-containing protein n=1 Tax=Thermosulfurimonas sp. F29 TaxID=2867247 RepID=UPI001C83B8A3|nr:SPOR domain-containing protein [Thermosulfurimonas sp. F29]MBX6423943.1 SPOR domain-containing protein [Thermosulfurimonas sp. F29]
MAKRFRIELGFLGLVFVFLLLVCLFLWMFILGVWFGERMVGKGPSPVAEKTLRKEKVPEEVPAEEVSPPPGVLAPGRLSPPPTEKSPAPGGAPSASTPETSVPSEKAPAPSVEAPSKPAPSPKAPVKPREPYFTLQVASFRDPAEAERYVRIFRDRGYAAQVTRVNIPGKGIWYRVYVGRFASRDEAEKAYRRLRSEKLVKKAYIKKIQP